MIAAATSPSPLAQGVAILALLGLLVTAWRHPRPLTEALAALAAGGAVLLCGAVPWADAREALERLAPVVVFLAAVLVVADVCGRAGLFSAAAAWAGRLAGSSPGRLLLAVVAIATVVTTVLSLDATVVLLTPVVIAVAAVRGFSPAPGAWICLRLANSASLLLPVANLTNLLAMPDLDLGFGAFARAMAPTLVVVVLAEWLLTRVLLRSELHAPVGPAEGTDASPARVPWTPVVVVIAMLVGFAVGSAFGVEPGWIAAVAAAALLAWALPRGLLSAPEAVRAAAPSFALYVLGLGVVVAGVADSVLGDLLRDLVRAVVGGADPSVDLGSAAGLGVLLGIAAVATLVANLVTNLSATLLVVPLVAPLGPLAVLAALIGLDAGAGLTYTGSLANLLWRRTLTGSAAPTTLREFHRRSLPATPVVVVLAVITLWATSGLA